MTYQEFNHIYYTYTKDAKVGYTNKYTLTVEKLKDFVGYALKVSKTKDHLLF